MDESFFIYLLVGLLAQIVDGAIGMAYGVISTSVLLTAGVAPAAASAAVHLAKVFTGAASGASHLLLGNVDRQLCFRLVIPGVIGGVLGAILVSKAPGDLIKPAVAGYLLLMGLLLVGRAFNGVERSVASGPVRLLGFVGGLVDSLGGGWGPVVTSTLLAKGYEPRRAIGSVNLAEFFVTILQSATFFVLLGLVHVQIVAGLVVGGVVAAPLAAWLCSRLPAKLLIFFVGTLVSLLSLRTLWLSF